MSIELKLIIAVVVIMLLAWVGLMIARAWETVRRINARLDVPDQRDEYCAIYYTQEQIDAMNAERRRKAQVN